MSIKAYFPTFIYDSEFSAIRGRRLNDRLLDSIGKLEKFDVDGRRWSKKNYRGGYTSYSSMSDLHKQFSIFSELEESLRPHAEKFGKHLNWNLGKGRIVMTTCWASRMPQNTYHPLHLHPLCILSGTYYVSVPKGASALKIEDPRADLFMASPARPNYIHLEPKPGRFYLFESWLRHEVPPNPVAGDRISVSFNYEWQ